MDFLRTVVRRQGAVRGVRACSTRTRTCMQCQHSPNLRTRCTQPIQPMFRCHLGTVTSGYRMVVLLVCYSAASHYLVPPNRSAKLFEMHRMPDLCLSVVEITTWGVRFWSTIGKFSWVLLVRSSRSRGERSATRGKYPLEEQLQVASPCPADPVGMT